MKTTHRLEFRTVLIWIDWYGIVRDFSYLHFKYITIITIIIFKIKLADYETWTRTEQIDTMIDMNPNVPLKVICGDKTRRLILPHLICWVVWPREFTIGRMLRACHWNNIQQVEICKTQYYSLHSIHWSALSACCKTELLIPPYTQFVVHSSWRTFKLQVPLTTHHVFPLSVSLCDL